MLNFLKRFFRLIRLESHNALDKLEDPVKMAEEGIRNLKRDLEFSLKNLVEIKAISVLQKKELENKKNLAIDYERKAILLLQKAQDNQINPQESDRLASEALLKRNEAYNEALKMLRNLENQEKMIVQLENKIRKLKNAIINWKNELSGLKARSKAASSIRKINEQFAQINSDSTAALIDNLKTKIEKEEALAQAYENIGLLENNIDAEINKALEGTIPPAIADSLADLKLRLLTQKNCS